MGILRESTGILRGFHQLRPVLARRARQELRRQNAELRTELTAARKASGFWQMAVPMPAVFDDGCSHVEKRETLVMLEKCDSCSVDREPAILRDSSRTSA